MSGEGLRSTLAVSLWGGQLRGGAPNSATLMHRAARPDGAPQRIATARELFIGAYARFADGCRAVDEPGIAVIAVDEASGQAAGIVKLCARVQRPVVALVGRHDRCDLYLEGREDLSLRQLAIVLDPVTSWVRGATSVRYRMLDLRTTQAMVDEDGRPLRGLVAEGPAIVRCAGYVLYVLPLGDPSDWPAAGAEAWAMLPERVYLDELASCAQGSLPRLRMPRADVRETFITRTSGPRDTGMRLAQGDARRQARDLHAAPRALARDRRRTPCATGCCSGATTAATRPRPPARITRCRACTRC